MQIRSMTLTKGHSDKKNCVQRFFISYVGLLKRNNIQYSGTYIRVKVTPNLKSTQFTKYGSTQTNLTETRKPHNHHRF